MKKWIVPVLAALVVATSTPAPAADLKIGYIITPRLQSESKLGKEWKAKLTGKMESLQKTLDKKRTEVKKLQDDIEKRMAVLNDSEKQKLGEEYDRQIRDAKRMNEDAQREMQKAEAEMQADMSAKFRAVIEKFAQDNGYDMILDATMLLYISEKADVTEEVIKLADKGS